jgi:flavorubredoxin
MPLAGCHRSDVATELLDAGALLVGSPTLNGQMFPTVADVMSYVKGLKLKHLVGAAFGSHGWSGEGVRQLEAILDEMGVERVAESETVTYVPDDAALKRCYELGAAVAGRLKDRATAAIG